VSIFTAKVIFNPLLERKNGAKKIKRAGGQGIYQRGARTMGLPPINIGEDSVVENNSLGRKTLPLQRYEPRNQRETARI